MVRRTKGSIPRGGVNCNFHKGSVKKKNNPIEKHSGTQLILEGVGVMLSGLLLYYAFFIWS